MEIQLVGMVLSVATVPQTEGAALPCSQMGGGPLFTEKFLRGFAPMVDTTVWLKDLSEVSENVLVRNLVTKLFVWRYRFSSPR